MEGRTVAIVPEFAPLCKKLLYFAAHKELEKFVKNVDPWAPLGSTSWISRSGVRVILFIFYFYLFFIYVYFYLFIYLFFTHVHFKISTLSDSVDSSIETSYIYLFI